MAFRPTLRFATAPRIAGFGPGHFRLDGQVLRGAWLITPREAGPWGGLDDAGAVLTLAGRVDVLVLGTGPALTHLPPAFRAAVEAGAIGIEPMATPAACRTYNLLLGDGRRVAAALLPAG